MKNIAIFVMTPYYKDKKTDENKYSYKFSKKMYEECYHTNEVGLKYLMTKLAEKNQKLDYAYAIASNSAAKTVEDFKELFHDYRYPLTLASECADNESTLVVTYKLENEGSLKGVFGNINKLFENLLSYLGDDKENVTIHIDITSGQRPASMLLLAVIQMLKFYGYKTGYVIYSNLVDKDNRKAVVENASDLLEMYDLMSGTQSFISYGDVDEIKSYFGNKASSSDKLKILLEAMQKLSAALKICASYEAMVKVLAKLKDAIDKYEESLQNSGSIDDRELFFSELLPKIQSEYGEILPKDGKDVDVVGLIRWCLNKDMLQQAMTIYTEWLPDFIIDNKFIEVKDKNIVAQCIQQNKDAHQSYKSWQQRFLRGYVMPQGQGGVSSLTEFKNILTKINCNILNFDSSQYILSDSVNKFMEDVKMLQFMSQNKEDKFVSLFSELPAEHPIKAIFNAYKCDNVTVEEFVRTRFRRAKKSVSECILESIKQVKNDDMANILGLKAQNQYSTLLKAGKIQLTITEQEMLDIINSYKSIVDEYRNKSNHSKAIEGNNKLIKETIEKSLVILRK